MWRFGAVVMKRRNVVTGLLASVAAARPFATRAQPARPVIGFLSGVSLTATYLEAFHRSLAEGGYADGRDVIVEYRSAESHYDRLPALADDLVRRGVDVIVAAGGDVAARAATSATAKIPIVFSLGGDPVKLGLVASMNRPGANATGATLFTAELVSKRVELVRELVANAAAVSLLVNPVSPNAEPEIATARAAVRELGWQLHLVAASSEHDLDAVFASCVRTGSSALVITAGAYLLAARDALMALAARYSVPVVYDRREFVAAGGLISYGASIADNYRQAGIYVARILKGERPAELPVMQPTKFELVVNVTAAKALGLTLSPTLLARADEVIE